MVKIEWWIDPFWNIEYNTWPRIADGGWWKVRHVQLGRLVVQLVVRSNR